MTKKKGKYDVMFGPIPNVVVFKNPSFVEKVSNGLRVLRDKLLRKMVPMHKTEEDLRAEKFFAMEKQDFIGGVSCHVCTEEEMLELERNGFNEYPAIAREKGWEYFVSINRRVSESENGPVNDRTYQYGDVRVLKEFIPIPDGHDDDPMSLF